MESKDARLFRRFDGCRFLVAFPCSIPIAEMVPPFVVLDGLNSASNVGQVLRTAYHLGVNSVIVSPGAWSCLNGPRLQSINGLVLSNEFPCCAAFVQGNPRVEATWSLPLCCWKSILAASCSSSAPRRSEMGIGYWQWIFWRIRRDCARVRPKSLRSAATGTFPKRCTCLLHLFVWAIQIQCHGAGKRIAAPSRSTVIWPWKRNSRKRLKASYSLQTAFQTIVTIYHKNYCLSPCIFYIWWDQRRQSAGRLSKERRGAQRFPLTI